MRDYIPINRGLIPYSFTILLNDQWFEVLIAYNKTSDLFTATLYKDGAVIVTEPIIYGVPMFRDVYRAGVFPSIDIVPLDESQQESEVTGKNFGELVLLTIDNEGSPTSDTLPPHDAK